jgi:putative Ca2+/H+ antiporter (TMEM165/GDT1 family)
MLIADAVGIIIGVVLSKKIPERTVKIFSAALFILFGFISFTQVLYGSLHLIIGVIIAILAATATITGIASYFLLKRERK